MTDRRGDQPHEADPRLRQAFAAEPDLENMVPDHLADGAWPRLAAELAARPVRRRRRRWLSMALAATLAALVTVSGWLTLENRQLRREAALERTLVTLAAPAPARSRTLTAGELSRRLALLPPDTPVLTTAEAERLLRHGQPLLYALVRGPRLDAITRDGVTAAEALTVLGRLDTDTPIRLGGAAAGRS
jgi:hypothetical protein